LDRRFSRGAATGSARPLPEKPEWQKENLAVSTVQLVGLRKSYGNSEVLHGIDLSIAEGEFVALVGPSGCGKSTMLRMIAGLEEITGGEVRIDGRAVNRETPKQRNIAMVFQNYALYPHMSVRQNIGLNLKIAGLQKPEIESRVMDAARLLDIVDLLDRRPAQLSGGQRQRVAMGRAIVRNPAAFLFDEPLSNLDAKLRVQMRSEIKALHAKVATTSIYVTHDQIEAMTLADRVVVMNQGRIEQEGTPIDLYESPANLFVAGFIGSPAMNFLPARTGAGGTEARLGDGTVVPIASRAGLPADRDVVLGIRPEHLEIVEAAPIITGIVEFVEPTGAQTQVSLKVGATSVTALVQGIRQFKSGTSLGLRVAPERVHVFDAESQQRI
jgi:multiple sugar transport system ATP-binding protein